jgi:hypothetical protein
MIHTLLNKTQGWGWGGRRTIAPSVKRSEGKIDAILTTFRFIFIEHQPSLNKPSNTQNTTLNHGNAIVSRIDELISTAVGMSLATARCRRENSSLQVRKSYPSDILNQ